MYEQTYKSVFLDKVGTILEKALILLARVTGLFPDYLEGSERWQRLSPKAAGLSYLKWQSRRQRRHPTI